MAQYTQRAIMSSFMRIVSAKSLDKITVKDIVEDCQITRNTFYYHFQDIYDLAAQVFSTEFEAIIRRNSEDRGDWYAELLAIAEFAKKNRSATLHIYNSSRREELLRVLNQALERYLLDVICHHPAAADASREDIALIAHVLRCTLVGMGQDWLAGGMKESPGPRLARMRQLFETAVAQALKSSASSQQKPQDSPKEDN